jgi:hypothetical protein
MIAVAGFVAGAVRVLPWALDPDVPLRAALPFARGLGAVIVESAVLVGWPVGWCLALFRAVEAGEARVLQSLGEGPLGTIARLAPQGAAFALALVVAGFAWGRDAGAPGAVATDLVAQARVSCASAGAPVAYAVPFTHLTWLCVPHREPVLVGSLSTMQTRVDFSAKSAQIAGDFRSIRLEDARVRRPGTLGIEVHAGSLTVHGLAPWAQASNLPALLRGLILALAGAATSLVGAALVLGGAAESRLEAFALGAIGPLAALGVLRWLERLGSSAAVFVFVPCAAVCVTAAAGALGKRLRRRLKIASQ